MFDRSTISACKQVNEEQNRRCIESMEYTLRKRYTSVPPLALSFVWFVKVRRLTDFGPVHRIRVEYLNSNIPNGSLSCTVDFWSFYSKCTRPLLKQCPTIVWLSICSDDFGSLVYMQLCDSFYLKGPKTAKNATTRIPVVSTAHATLMVFVVSIITPSAHL